MVRKLADPEVLAALEKQSEYYNFVLVPGFKNSGEEHWQSYWERDVALFTRISQRRWDLRDIELWIDAIGRVVAAANKPSILIGHSLGALATASVAADGTANVAGAMLVAPADPRRFDADERVPDHELPIPSVLVASHNDKLLALSQAKQMATCWGAEFVDVGEAGHINSEAGFGRWPYGLNILVELVRRIDPNLGATAA